MVNGVLVYLFLDVADHVLQFGPGFALTIPHLFFGVVHVLLDRSRNALPVTVITISNLS